MSVVGTKWRAGEHGRGVQLAHSPLELLPAPGQALGFVSHQVQHCASHLLLEGAPIPADAQAAEGGWRDTLRLGGGPKRPPHSTPARTSSHSPPLAVEVLGPVGDVERLVPLPRLLPPPLGSPVGSGLLPLPADNFCEDVLVDGGPASPAAPREQTGLPTHQPSWGLGPGTSGTLRILIRTRAPAETGLVVWGWAGCRPG